MPTALESESRVVANDKCMPGSLDYINAGRSLARLSTVSFEISLTLSQFAARVTDIMFYYAGLSCQ